MRKITATIIVFFAIVLASCSSQPKWVLLHPSINPPPLAHSGFVYDTNSNEGVVFGGIFKDMWSDETWIWNGNDWHKADVAHKPPAREKVAMAYDEVRDKIIIFGGSMDKTVFDDTWEWDGKTWQLLKPVHTPPARCCHAMAYDSMQKKVLLYGGWNHITGEFFNDTWAWDGKDWTQLPSGNVPLSAAHMLVNFSSVNKLVAVPSSTFANTWEWDGDSWNETLSHPLPSRADGRSAYDSQYKRVVLFGGIENSNFLNDTWVFDGQTWNLLNVSSAPSPRYAHIMFYDVKRHSIILFGGAGKESLLGDTWELRLPQDLSAVIIVDKTATP
ncbi:MAG TPA: kelch repeat-containing protein [Anaerolineales bacterium]|nr:kelch repeat-containing protein [Anaerolineales bacterium]